MSLSTLPPHRRVVAVTLLIPALVALARGFLAWLGGQ